jgi:hypothetical protein
LRQHRPRIALGDHRLDLVVDALQGDEIAVLGSPTPRCGCSAPMPEHFEGAPMLVGPEERHIVVAAPLAQHVGSGNHPVLLGQAPVLAHRAPGEGRWRCRRPPTGLRWLQMGVDLHRAVFAQLQALEAR